MKAKGFKLLEFGDVSAQLEKLHEKGLDSGMYVGFPNISKNYNMLPGSCTDWLGFPQCFTKEQLIQTESGPKPISEVVIGEKVLSYNHSTDKNEYRTVINTLRHENTKQRLYRITLKDGTIIKVTEDHEFFDGKNYVKIKELLDNVKSKKL